MKTPQEESVGEQGPWGVLENLQPGPGDLDEVTRGPQEEISSL